MTRRRLALTGLVALMLFFSSFAAAKTVRFGIIYDGVAARFADTRTMFINEIQGVIQGAHSVAFPPKAQIDVQWSPAATRAALDKLMANRRVDMILVLGEAATHVVCQRKTFAKPVFAAHVVDAKIQGIPSRKGASGVRNLNYVSLYADHERAFQTFKEIAPFSRAVVIKDRLILDAIPQMNRLVRRLANEFTADITIVAADASARDVLDRIPADTQAVFLSLLPRMPKSEFARLVGQLIARKLPSFSIRGRADVAAGVMVSTVADGSRLHMARSLALNIQEALEGADPGRLATTFAAGEKLTINMATARAIGVYPGWGVLTEADLINDQVRGTADRLNLRLAVKEALSANLNLAAANQQVAAGAEQVRQARSSLLPQVGVNTQASVIDDDRAEASLGIQPERLWTGSIQASQLIYSDKAWAGYTIEQFRQTAREQGRDAVRLDIVQAAATTYLNVLRAKSIERIQTENLKLTRENLERARIRVQIGTGGPEEVYRWENQIANSRRSVLTAQSVTLDTIAAVNNLLDRPLRMMFTPEEADYKNPMDILADRRLTAHMDNPMALAILRDFLVREGLDGSPELARTRAAIDAQQRNITLAKREFWVPTVSLFGDVTETFSKGGEGSGTPSLGAITLSGKDDTDWTAGIQASLPLYAGGGRSAALKRARQDLARLQFEYKNTANGIENRVLNAVHLIRASYPGIGLSIDAAESARRNLNLVTDAYVRGIKSIIDLIDAQNQSLVADQQTANAVYDFLIDLMAVQRSVGRFFLFDPAQQRNAWMQRLDDFAATARSTSPNG